MNLKWIIIENLILVLITIFSVFLYIKSKSRKIKTIVQPLNEEKKFLEYKQEELIAENEILNKELEKNSSIIQKLTDKLNKVQKDFEEHVKNYNELKSNYEELREEYEKLNILMETLSSLFNGKKTENINEIEKIEKLGKFLLNEFIPKIDDLNILDNEYMKFSLLHKSFEQWKITQIRGWSKEKINIALIGKFSSGKSSIVNSLLSIKLLPVETTPTTAVPTFVAHGYDDKVYYEDNEGNIREIDLNIFKNISYVTLKEFPISYFIRYFVVFNDISSFKEVNILDTPGFSSDKEIDFQRVSESIDLSDIIFYVLDINDGTLTHDAIQVLKNIKNENLYIILNKSDTKPPSERQKIKEHVINILNENQINFIDVIIYSSKKNINNCLENLKNLINKLKKEKQKKERSLFDQMIEICEICIHELKARYSLDLSLSEADKLEKEIKILNSLLEKTKKLKMEAI